MIMDFRTWIAKFKDVDLPIGDLAQDVIQDSEFPISYSFEVIYEHLIDVNADMNVLHLFRDVFTFYEMDCFRYER